MNFLTILLCALANTNQPKMPSLMYLKILQVNNRYRNFEPWLPEQPPAHESSDTKAHTEASSCCSFWAYQICSLCLEGSIIVRLRCAKPKLKMGSRMQVEAEEEMRLRLPRLAAMGKMHHSKCPRVLHLCCYEESFQMNAYLRCL